MKIKKSLAAMLGAVILASSAITPVLAADEVDTEVANSIEATDNVNMEAPLIESSNARAITMWTQYVPQTNASSDSDTMILFKADKSTVTFTIHSLNGIPNINIAVVGFFYGDWGTTSLGRSITFTGLTPGNSYNAKFSCYTGSGTALIQMN